MKLFILLLFAFPLSAQQTVVIPDMNIIVEPTPIVNEITVIVEAAPLDSAGVARQEAATQAMADIVIYLAEREPVGTSNVIRIANAGLTLAAFLIVWRLGQLVNKEHPDHPTHEPHPNYPKHDKSGKSDR